MCAEAKRPIHILMVEDNPADVDLTREALSEGKILNHLSVVGDGETALQLLRAADVRPDLILLDLNLPGRSGLEILAEIKEDPALRRIPVVVLTSSKAEEDVLRSYDLHANSYITKPVDFEQFCRVVRAVEAFWFTIVRLPAR